MLVKSVEIVEGTKIALFKDRCRHFENCIGDYLSMMGFFSTSEGDELDKHQARFFHIRTAVKGPAHIVVPKRRPGVASVSYTHLTLPTTAYV